MCNIVLIFSGWLGIKYQAKLYLLTYTQTSEHLFTHVMVNITINLLQESTQTVYVEYRVGGFSTPFLVFGGFNVWNNNKR